MSTAKSGSTASEPMEFETVHMRNTTNERGRLAREAEGLSRTELIERAADVGVNTEGTKEQIAERVRDAARGD